MAQGAVSYYEFCDVFKSQRGQFLNAKKHGERLSWEEIINFSAFLDGRSCCEITHICDLMRSRCLHLAGWAPETRFFRV